MGSVRAKILLIEDDKVDQIAFKRLVEDENLYYDYTIAASVAEAKKILDCQRFDMVITDYSFGDGTAFDIFDSIKDTAFIFVTGVGDEETAVKAMKAGAYDYLIKDKERNYLKILPVTVENAIRHMKAERQFSMLSHAIMSINDSVYITDINNKIIFVNKAFCETYGYKEKEILGRHYNVLCKEKSVNGDVNSVKYLRSNATRNITPITAENCRKGEFCNKRKNGSEFPISLSNSSVKDEKGNEVAIVRVARDITEFKRAEEQIKASLKEKEVLLMEIHHRVKNNMQVISSMLSLQAEYIKDKKAMEMFKQSQNRVKSMALIHEKLYQSEDLARINFTEYIRNLTSYLLHFYQENSAAIELKIKVDGVFLGVDTAIPCGLIINELVSNSLKHAFPQSKEGEIRVELHQDKGKLAMIVADNGVGFPKDVDFRDTESLGLQLVNTLVNQLDGNIELFSNGGGTKFKIAFKEVN